MGMNKYSIKLSFIRDLIGSQPSNEDIKNKYIVAKMLTGKTGMSAEVAQNKVKDEIANLRKDEGYMEKVDEMQEKAFTVFFRDANGKICLSDIQARGFIKDAFAFAGKENKFLTKKSGDAYSSDESYRKYIGERIMFPKQYMPFKKEDGAEIEVDIFSRPIRCKTMMGDRVSIASSERIKAPAYVEIDLVTTEDVKPEWLTAIFDRGMFKGMSQWANGQYGTFTYEMIQK